MTWFEAYILWKVGTIGTIIAFAGSAFLLICVINWISYSFIKERFSTYYEGGWEEKEKDLTVARKRAIKWSWICVPLAVTLWVTSALIPNTSELLKILATKKGTEVLQSERIGKITDKANNIIDNALDLLNQTIEQKLEEKEKKS